MDSEHTDSESQLARRAGYWRSTEHRIPALADNKPVDVDALRQSLRDYPELARDVAVARRLAPHSRITRSLEQTYAALHRALYRPPKQTAGSLRHTVTEEIPAIVNSLRGQILAVTAGFFIAAACGYYLVHTYPELASLFASDAMIRKVQAGELWTDGLLNIMPASLLSLQIFTNNIVVALTAMSLGLLYGLGTIYIIALNGLMIGGVFALTAHYDLADRLFTFVAAHGPVELTIIFIAAAIGFSLGEAIARPGATSRSEAFREAATRGTKLMILCVLFLIGAGIIEGYISPNDAFSLPARLLVGWGYWALLLLALRGFRISHPRSDA